MKLSKLLKIANVNDIRKILSVLKDKRVNGFIHSNDPLESSSKFLFTLRGGLNTNPLKTNELRRRLYNKLQKYKPIGETGNMPQNKVVDRIFKDIANKENRFIANNDLDGLREFQSNLLNKYLGGR